VEAGLACLESLVVAPVRPSFVKRWVREHAAALMTLVSGLARLHLAKCLIALLVFNIATRASSLVTLVSHVPVLRLPGRRASDERPTNAASTNGSKLLSRFSAKDTLFFTLSNTRPSTLSRSTPKAPLLALPHRPLSAPSKSPVTAAAKASSPTRRDCYGPTPAGFPSK
jgi:hypothetical protein